MAFPNYSDIVATTIANYSKSMADNVTSHNALLGMMKKQGGVQVTGGDPIYEIFNFAENGNGGSYSGYDELPTGAQDVISGAQFTLAQYAVPVVFSGREKLLNSGPQQMIDLIEARVSTAESTMANLLNRHLYLDGTGNNGKNITGLAAAVSTAPTTGTYGNISRVAAANAFWRNQAWQASVDGGAIATAATIQLQWNNFMTRHIRGTDKPTLIVAGPAVYSIFQASLQTIQRIASADTANAGFSALEFQGVPVVFDTLASGIATTSAFFLNTKYLKFRPHKDRNMVSLDDKSAFNQDATAKTLAWAGNLTCSGAQFQGVFRNV